MFLSENLQEKWSKKYSRNTRYHQRLKTTTRKVTAVILENQETLTKIEFFLEKAPLNATGSSAISNWDPILISLV